MRIKGLITICLIGAAFLGHHLATRPILYRQCSSPSNDDLVLKVHRARTFPYIEGVAVIVSVEGPNGKHLYKEIISNEDLWTDVDQRYPIVLCEPDRFIVGPNWWDGSKQADFVLLKSKVLSLTD